MSLTHLHQTKKHSPLKLRKRKLFFQQNIALQTVFRQGKREKKLQEATIFFNKKIPYCLFMKCLIGYPLFQM